MRRQGRSRVPLVVFLGFAVLGFFIFRLVFGIMPGLPTLPPNCTKSNIFCAGLVTAFGGVDDHASNQSAWEGLQQAKNEGMADWVAYIESIDSRDYGANIAAFADAGYDVIVTVGYNLGDATLAAADEYPGVYFIGIDQFQAALRANLAGLVFPEDQAGFLAGALATQMTRTDRIGAVCVSDVVSAYWRYCEGYRAGAGYVNPLVSVEVMYHEDVNLDTAFADNEWGAAKASAMIDEGADVIFGAGGAAGEGALVAAAQRGVYVIGAETDVYYTLPEAQDMLLTSAVKLSASGILALLGLAQEDQADRGNFTGGNYVGEIGYASYHDLENQVPAEVKAKMEAILLGLKSGRIQTGVTPEKQ